MEAMTNGLLLRISMPRRGIPLNKRLRFNMLTFEVKVEQRKGNVGVACSLFLSMIDPDPSLLSKFLSITDNLSSRSLGASPSGFEYNPSKR